MNPNHRTIHTFSLVFLAMLVLAVCACEQKVDQKPRKDTQDLLKDQFAGTTFPSSVWATFGTGVLVQDSSVGDPAPSLRLDSSGVQAGIISSPLDASAHFRVSIAIDPAAGSGASATMELRDGTTSSLIASVTVEEGLITYRMGSSTPVTQAWTTDGAFHLYEFIGSNSGVSGGHWWLRDGTQVASYASPTGSTQMTMALMGPSSGDAWFDDAWVFHYLAHAN